MLEIFKLSLLQPPVPVAMPMVASQPSNKNPPRPDQKFSSSQKANYYHPITLIHSDLFTDSSTIYRLPPERNNHLVHQLKPFLNLKHND